MKTDVHQTLYPLMREYIEAMGASLTVLAALKSYIDAIERLTCSDTDFAPSVMALNEVIRNSEPQLVPLVHIIDTFEKEMARLFNQRLEIAKTKAVEIIERISEEFSAATEKVTQHCMAHIEPDDFIIVHSPTAYLRNAFVRTHIQRRLSFKVLVLKQDYLRTKDLVDAFNEHNVAHLLIPEHNLSHYMAETNKLFISAVAITADHKAITGPGTANVVSICHAHRVPVYLYVESIKFSTKPLADQHIYKQNCKKMEAGSEFEMTTFSHDYVELAMVDHIITEKGE